MVLFCVVMTTAGIVSTLAGSSDLAQGYVDGVGTEAKFFYPNGVAVTVLGDVIVADTYNNNIRTVTSSGKLTSSFRCLSDFVVFKCLRTQFTLSSFPVLLLLLLFDT